MTTDRRLKHAIRQVAKQMGIPYTVARRQVLAVMERESVSCDAAARLLVTGPDQAPRGGAR